jgi:hypothetical protein
MEVKKITDLLTELAKTKKEIKLIQADEKAFKTQQRELETQIVIRMQEQGLDKVSNDLCTVSIKQEIVPTVQDWDLLQEHVAKTNQFELLQKRMSATAYRELMSLGMDVPGVVSTELTRVNFRST